MTPSQRLIVAVAVLTFAAFLLGLFLGMSL